MLTFSNEFCFPTNYGVELDVDLFMMLTLFSKTCLPTEIGIMALTFYRYIL